MALQPDDLAALDGPLPGTSGLPLMLPLDSIDEDPDQPRREFDGNALQELAQTIRERGVRQPISVRPNLRQQGGWMLNFGARRLRAARLATLAEIPAFIDSTADDYDQVIENEQREGLRPLDLALFVQKRLAMGDNQAEIARRLGKSRQWVTFTTALIDPPDWLLDLYRQGKCRGMMELYELRPLHAENGSHVQAWMAGQDTITRNAVARLRVELKAAAPDAEVMAAPATAHAETSTTGAVAAVGASGNEFTAAPAAASAALPEKAGRNDAAQKPLLSRPTRQLHVEMDGCDYELILTEVPSKQGHVWLRTVQGGPRFLATVEGLKVKGFASV